MVVRADEGEQHVALDVDRSTVARIASADELVDERLLHGRVERAHGGAFVEAVAELRLLEPCHQAVHDLVEPRTVHVDALRVHADLTRGVVDGGEQPVEVGVVDDRVVEDHGRVVAAELEGDPGERLRRHLHHALAAAGVNVKHPDTQVGRSCYRTGNCIGNIMEFEVEKHLESPPHELLHIIRPRSGKQLFADLEATVPRVELLHQVFRLSTGGKVERNDDRLKVFAQDNSSTFNLLDTSESQVLHPGQRQCQCRPSKPQC